MGLFLMKPHSILSKCILPIKYPVMRVLFFQSWMWVGLPLFIYTCDTLYSYCRRHLLETEVINVTKYPGNILQLHLVRKNFHIRPGQVHQCCACKFHNLIKLKFLVNLKLHPNSLHGHSMERLILLSPQDLMPNKFIIILDSKLLS